MITRSKEPPTPPATPPTKAALSEESEEVPVTKSGDQSLQTTEIWFQELSHAVKYGFSTTRFGK